MDNNVKKYQGVKNRPDESDASSRYHVLIVLQSTGNIVITSSHANFKSSSLRYCGLHLLIVMYSPSISSFLWEKYLS